MGREAQTPLWARDQRRLERIGWEEFAECLRSWGENDTAIILAWEMCGWD